MPYRNAATYVTTEHLASGTQILVTGAHGCIGAWVVRELVAAGLPLTTFDLSRESRRLQLILGDAVGAVPHVVGDITDLAAVERALDEHGITHVIHLAALQMPLVRADPPLGAAVNVVGTVNVFEAALRRQLASIVYASSVAAYSAEGALTGHPRTLYGVFKRSNEATAAVYYEDGGIASVGLRPHTVYGVGRDQGATSAPTSAMLAAAANVPYTIPYRGVAQLQLARDVGRWFVQAALAKPHGAQVHNLPGHSVEIDEVIKAIRNAAPAASVDCAGTHLPLPGTVDSTSFASLVPHWVATPLALGINETIQSFRDLLTTGAVTSPG